MLTPRWCEHSGRFAEALVLTYYIEMSFSVHERFSRKTSYRESSIEIAKFLDRSLTSEDASGFSIMPFGNIISAVGHDTPDDMTELPSHGGNSNQLMFVLAFFLEPEVS